jgi:ubiquinone/menaquinone biosynthesis C-methylase UbiE
MKKDWSGERLETFILGRDSIEHIHRYALAMDFIENKTVLDIACGNGYGSSLMSEKATTVYGVDIDQETVEKAKKSYLKKNLNFLTGSADKIPLADESVDVVVSFETIEHHDKHDEMMVEIKRVLKKDGLLIISTPDKLYYTDYRKKFQNEFHVKELYKNEFSALITNYFKNSLLLTQKYYHGSSVIEEDNGTNEIVIHSGSYEQVEKDIADPLFLVIIASDNEVKKINPSVFNGTKIIETGVINSYEKSYNYRVGKMILTPFKFFLKK